MNEMSDTNSVVRPRLCFYHPNAKGTGSAMSIQLHPAFVKDGVSFDGFFHVRMANQSSVGTGGVFPKFGWDDSIDFDLRFDDACAILQVFRGECETINEGRGLYHRTANGTIKITLRHTIDPVCGYMFEVYRSSSDGARMDRSSLYFSPSESLGLCEAITGSLALVTFGVPSVCASI